MAAMLAMRSTALARAIATPLARTSAFADGARRHMAAGADLDEESSSLGVMGLERRVLDIRRVSKTTKGGRHPSVSVFVVVGNGNGAAGYALGKGENVGDATLKASLRAVKRMQAFNRCGDRTLPHRVEQKLGATRVQLWPLPAGSGARTHRVIADICDCIGLDGVGGKVLGSRNVGNVIHATFAALAAQRTPQDVARDRSLKVVDLSAVFEQREHHSRSKHT